MLSINLSPGKGKKMRKRYLVIILLMVAAVMFAVIIHKFASDADKHAVYENTDEGKDKVVLSIPYSSGIIGITGMDGEGGEEDTGPESFFITGDNQIYILDTNNHRILVFNNGNLAETIQPGTDKEGLMIDIEVAGENIYVLLSNDVILKMDHSGTILERIDISGYKHSVDNSIMGIDTEISIKPRYISYEDGCLKIHTQDDKVYNLTDKNASVEDRNVRAGKNGFDSVSSAGKTVEFPSFFSPVSASKVTSLKGCDVYYTSEMYHGADGITTIRRLYFVSSGKLEKYVQLKPVQFTMPNRLYRVTQDGSVYQMITTKEKLEIVKLGFSEDYSRKPDLIE